MVLLRVFSCVRVAVRKEQYRLGSSIPVILTQDIDSRGKQGSEITVKRGFARNYLIPRKLAVYATGENRIKFGLATPSAAELAKMSTNSASAVVQ